LKIENFLLVLIYGICFTTELTGYNMGGISELVIQLTNYSYIYTLF